jgi:pimeloyl-ACP methyl ester carboxylesterase
MNLPYRVLVVPVFLILSGCGQPVYYLMPDPVADHRSSYEFTPDEDKNGTILIGFATNRLIAPADSGKYYAKEYDQDLRFGNAFVQIGSGDETWDEILDVSLEANRGEDVPLTLTGVHRMGRLPATAGLDNLPPDIKRLFDNVNTRAQRYPIKEVTVYLHGANTSFYRAAALGAQYHHFSGRLAPFIVYAWPSAESLLQYKKDVINAEATVPAFVRFIKLLAQNTNVEKINILAYSAGAQLATKALAALGSDQGDADRERYRKSLRLGTVYYAAPDADFETFIGQLRTYIDLVDNVTITINRNDSVLKLSERFHKGSRLGMPDPDETDPSDREWASAQTRTDNLDIIEIDAGVIPNIEAGAHNYWYNSPWVSTDTMLLLLAHIKPEDRGLVSTRGENSGEIWTFPPDYDQRVARKIAELRESWLPSLGGAKE